MCATRLELTVKYENYQCRLETLGEGTLSAAQIPKAQEILPHP